MTEFLDHHPGGFTPILEQAGEDCTEIFESIFHSRLARNELKQYLIGRLQGAELTALHEGADEDEVDDAFSGGSCCILLVMLVGCAMNLCNVIACGAVSSRKSSYLSSSSEETEEEKTDV